MKDEMEQQYFKEKLYERMWKLEGIMNELKNYHDLKRAQYRGLENTQLFCRYGVEYQKIGIFYSLPTITDFNPTLIIFFNRPPHFINYNF